jgi:hypothetical protein
MIFVSYLIHLILPQNAMSAYVEQGDLSSIKLTS